jgi:Tol biopolymer transport system component
VRRVIRRCLEKDPRRRARDIAEVALQLDEDGGVAAAARPPARQLSWLLLAAAAVVVAATALALRWTDPPAGPAPAIEFTLAPPPDYTFRGVPAPSPDGRLIAFLAQDADRVMSLWIRPLDGPARQLEGTQGIAGEPVWSPDSRSLAFLMGDTWKRVNADGGPLVTIVSGVVADLGASWGLGDTMLLAPANRTHLSRVPATGGSLEAVTTLDTAKENSHRWPHVLPDGRHFLFTVRSDRPDHLGIKIGTFGSTEVRPLVSTPSEGKFAMPGWLLFMTPDAVLMAQRLDPRTWTLSGAAQPVAAPVRYNGPSFNGSFDASSDGRVLTYVSGSTAQGALAVFDRAGTPVGTIGPERNYRALRISPDGRRAAVELVDDRYATRDIWLVDTVTNALTRVTTHSATDWRPVFSPDGNSLAFASDRAGASTAFRIAVDGSGGEKLMYRHPSGGAFPSDWSRDGTHLLMQIENSQGRRSGFVSVPVDGSPPVTLIDNDPAIVSSGRYSPEGDRIAFASAATGAFEIYVMSIADRRRVRISTDGGLHPAWGRDGRELFFHDPRGTIFLATLDSGPGVIRSRPAPVLRPCTALNRVFVSIDAEAGFDVSADGSRMLARCDPPDALLSAITVVVNWQSRLRD